MDCTHPRSRVRYGIREQPRRIPDVYTGLWPEQYKVCLDCGATFGERWLVVQEMTESRLVTLLMRNAECADIIQHESQ